MPRAAIAFGSNLGDRAGTIDAAVRRLRAEPHLFVRAVSPYFETAPVGGPADAGPFLNGALLLECDWSPERLLHFLHAIEVGLGRVRTEPNAPRTIDLDLLLYDDVICCTPDLILPHPRMHERRFVLQPLAIVAPTMRHPLLNLTVAELAADLTDEPLVPWHRPRSERRELAGLKVFITGSSSGIGRATALELASAGAIVGIHSRKPALQLAELRSLLSAHGNRVAYCRADLSDPTALEPLVAEAWDALSGIDLWLNNAGADTLTGPAAEWSFEQKLRMLWAVDVQATMILSRAVGERMKRRGHGRILTIGWDQAPQGMEGDSGQLFAACKSAVMAFTKSLALSLAPTVNVNCIAPGWIRTAWGDQASVVWQERVRRETPLGRWGLPEDVAALVRWLASPAAAFQTGQTFHVNGGAVR